MACLRGIMVESDWVSSSDQKLCRQLNTQSILPSNYFQSASELISLRMVIPPVYSAECALCPPPLPSKSYMAFRFLFVTAVIAAAWSLLLLLLELLQVAMGRKIQFVGWRAFVYLGDWVRHWHAPCKIFSVLTIVCHLAVPL